MYDVLIIGAGPAGISAAIYSKRANVNILVLYNGISNLEKATKIENYYGFENGIDGKDLYEIGIKQAQNLNIEVKKEEVINIEKEDKEFVIYTNTNTYKSKSLILATGDKILKPNIKGITEFEGKGISYCAVCDGFFYKNKDVAVVGNGKFAINEANELKNIAEKVTILTNGLEIEENTDIEINNKKIKEIQGENTVNKIIFEDDTELNVDGIFIALGQAGAVDFAKKLGIMLDKNSIVIDKNMKTNINGLYACGNTTGGLLQISKAVYEGTVAGLDAAKYVREEN